MLDLCDQKLRQRLSMASLAAVVLLPPHLENCQFRTLHLIHNLCFDTCVFQIWRSDVKLPILLDRKHPSKLNILTRLCLERKQPAKSGNLLDFSKTRSTLESYWHTSSRLQLYHLPSCTNICTPPISARHCNPVFQPPGETRVSAQNH